MLFRLMLVCIFLLPQSAMAIEEPKFDLIEKTDAFELRAYKPLIVAEVFVDGDMKEATNKGFKLIADYIFGNNKSKVGASEKISMTAPVALEAAPEKVAMTVPVAVQQASEQAAGKWRVHFVMPSKYKLETLPTPNNPQVMLREVAAKKFAVLRFSGLAGEEKTATKTQELMTWMASKQLKPIGTTELARYNPPWTLPFLRRNEVMAEY